MYAIVVYARFKKRRDGRFVIYTSSCRNQFTYSRSTAAPPSTTLIPYNFGPFRAYKMFRLLVRSPSPPHGTFVIILFVSRVRDTGVTNLSRFVRKQNVLKCTDTVLYIYVCACVLFIGKIARKYRSGKNRRLEIFVFRTRVWRRGNASIGEPHNRESTTPGRRAYVRRIYYDDHSAANRLFDMARTKHVTRR